MVSRRLIPWLAMVMVLVGLSKGDLSVSTQKCLTLFGNNCLPYIGNSSRFDAPPMDCCTRLKSVTDMNMVCSCMNNLLYYRDNFQLGYKINATLLLGLPDTCGMPVDITDCPTLLNMPANSTGALLFLDNYTSSKNAETGNTTAVDPSVDKKKSQPPAPTLENNITQTTNQNTIKDDRMAGHKVGLIAGLVVAVLSLSAIVAVCYLWRRSKHRRSEMGYDAEMNKDFEQGTGPKRFSYKEILHATNSFAEINKLGEGGFGGVYKGFLKDLETYVAVKRVSKTSQQGIREYIAEVKIISRLRHKNLVELKGWCHEKSELLLIYEFMENGSLDLHLFKQKSLLTWDKRKRIAYGLASGLSYLHEDCKECILHRDIKSSNVMLDSNFNVRLGDFGLAKLVDHEKGSQTTMVIAGTMGYMAPEYVVTGKASKESDVFSFGVVALEIACGRKPIEYKAHQNQVKLVEWVWDLYGTGSIVEAVDPSLGLDNTEEIERLLIVGLWCAHPYADQRPSMRQAIQVLNSEASQPKLPPKMPKITLNFPPTPSEFGDYSSSSGCSTLSSKLTTSSTTSSPSPLLFN